MSDPLTSKNVLTELADLESVLAETHHDEHGVAIARRAQRHVMDLEKQDEIHWKTRRSLLREIAALRTAEPPKASPWNQLPPWASMNGGCVVQANGIEKRMTLTFEAAQDFNDMCALLDCREAVTKVDRYPEWTCAGCGSPANAASSTSCWCCKKPRTTDETNAVPSGHFWRGEKDRTHCQNCGRSYFAHLHTDEASTCPSDANDIEPFVCPTCGDGVGDAAMCPNGCDERAESEEGSHE